MKAGHKVRNLRTVNYHSVFPAWFESDYFKERSAGAKVVILDFPYHPRATIWFDHHETPFRKKGWGKNFKNSDLKRWEPKYASCCHQTLNALSNYFKINPPGYLKELARWGDKIDGARYKDAWETIESKEPAMMIRDLMEESKEYSEKPLAWLVEELSEKSLAEAAKDKRVVEEAARFIREKKKSFSYYKRNCQIVGRVVWINEEDLKTCSLRFAPAAISPKSEYVIRMSKKSNGWHITAGQNPWNKPKKIVHIGNLLNKWGGGGHERVGGLEIKTKVETTKILEDILKVLNT